MNHEKLPPSLGIPDSEWETIKELRLNNAEWMRYRLSGQLPERAEALMKQRYKDQMKASKLFNPPSPEISVPTDINFEKEKPVYLKELDVIIESLHGSLDWEQLVQKTASLQSGAKGIGLYIQFLKDRDFAVKVDEKITAIISQILIKMDDSQTPSKKQAIGFIVISHLLDWAPNYSRLLPMMTEKLQEKIKNNDFEVFAILLREEGCVSDIAFRELFKAHEKPVSTHGYFPDEAGTDTQLKKDLLASIGDSLTILTQKKVRNNGLESVDQETKYLDWLIETLQTPGLLQELTAEGFNLKKLSDNYISAIMQEYDEIGGGYPSHPQTGNIVSLIGNFYASIGGKRIQMTDDVIQLIRKLYDKKIVPYEGRTSSRSWAYSVSKKLGLTPDVIDPNYKAA